MSITEFSFFMALLYSSLFIFAVHLLRKNRLFLRSFGTTTILFLYVVCFVRMGVALEFPFTKVIGLRRVYDTVYTEMVLKSFPVAGIQMNWLKVLAFIWAASSSCVLARFLWKHCRQVHKAGKFSGNRNPLAETVLERVKKEAERDLKVTLCVYPGIGVPFAAGIIHPRIVLPADSFTEQDLYYVLKHEYGHLCNHDLITLLLVHVFCCIFWWNPMVYVLKTDVEQMLEIKCDMVVAQNLSKAEKLEYLQLLQRVVAECLDKRDSAPRIASHLLHKRDGYDIEERFKLIAKPAKNPGWVGQAVIAAVSLAVLFVSYCIALQPAYDPPVADIYTDNSVREIEFASPEWYIVKCKDGSYFVVQEDGGKFPIKSESVESFLNYGLEIKEE